MELSSLLNHAGQRRDGKYARQLIFHAALSPNKAAAEPGDQIEASLASHLRAQCPQTAAGASFILGAAGSCKQRGPGPPGRATQEPFRLISLAQHRSAHSSWRACSARDHHQASLHLPAATGLPRKAGLAANAYLKSAALLVRKRSQRSDGAVMHIGATYCFPSPNIKASRRTLRGLQVGIAQSHANAAQPRRSGAYTLNLLPPEP